MDKQKAINDLCETLYDKWDWKLFWISHADFFKIANIAIDNGYGNISQVLTEFVEKLKGFIDPTTANGYRVIKISELDLGILLKEFLNE